MNAHRVCRRLELCALFLFFAGISLAQPTQDVIPKPPKSAPVAIDAILDCVDCSNRELSTAFQALPDEYEGLQLGDDSDAVKELLVFSFVRYGPPEARLNMYRARLEKQYDRIRNDEDWGQAVPDPDLFKRDDFINFGLSEYVAEYQIQAARVIGIVQPDANQYGEEIAELSRRLLVDDVRSDVRRAIADALALLKR